eukprot:3258245-Pleurochrysis_carterae.AAC.3
MRHLENRDLPAFVESALNSASACSSSASSAAANGGLWPAVSEWQVLKAVYMSAMVAGFDGTVRSAWSRVQPHHPELGRCSERRSAVTSSTT